MDVPQCFKGFLPEIIRDDLELLTLSRRILQRLQQNDKVFLIKGLNQTGRQWQKT